MSKKILSPDIVFDCRTIPLLISFSLPTETEEKSFINVDISSTSPRKKKDETDILGEVWVFRILAGCIVIKLQRILKGGKYHCIFDLFDLFGLVCFTNKNKSVSCHSAESKPVKQEVNGTVILPTL
jgi:hypothetical protein